MDKILHSLRNGEITLLDRWNLHVETRPDINTDNIEELQGVAKVKQIVMCLLYIPLMFASICVYCQYSTLLLYTKLVNLTLCCLVCLL